MKLIAFLSAGLLLTALARADYPIKEPFSQTSPFNANGELTLSSINGSITVHTWDKNEILIQGEKSAKTDEELKLIDLKMDVSPAAARIKVHLPKRSGGWFGGNSIRASVRFDITVPATAVVRKIDVVNASVTIEGVRGSVSAESVNGRISATDLAGDAHLETVNGQIHASFAALAPHQQLSFETVNGGIKVILPKDAGASVQAEVVNGHISCDFPLTLGKAHHRSLAGTIGDGRASVKAETVNGSIHLASR